MLGCPYEGPTDPAAVRRVSERLVDMGCYEISLGDTIGVGTPAGVYHMLHEVCKSVPVQQLAVHFHDTYARKRCPTC